MRKIIFDKYLKEGVVVLFYDINWLVQEKMYEKILIFSLSIGNSHDNNLNDFLVILILM